MGPQVMPPLPVFSTELFGLPTIQDLGFSVGYVVKRISARSNLVTGRKPKLILNQAN
jgi:hypothetical protein